MSKSLFDEQLRVWKMAVSSGNPNNNDLLVFARENKAKITELVKTEILRFKNVKVEFGFKGKFSIERNGETEYMEYYLREKDPQIFNRNSDEEEIKKEYDDYVEKMKEKIESWSENGSGWEVDTIMEVYVNVARYQPLRGGTYFPPPQELKNKKAIINVQNKDNECLKWALRAALFPAQKGKHPIRPRSYPVDDGIDYTGIVFPTPVKQMDKLEAQNANLAINVFGWENDHVIVHRISKKEAHVPWINLMLNASG